MKVHIKNNKISLAKDEFIIDNAPSPYLPSKNTKLLQYTIDEGPFMEVPQEEKIVQPINDSISLYFGPENNSHREIIKMKQEPVEAITNIVLDIFRNPEIQKLEWVLKEGSYTCITP